MLKQNECGTIDLNTGNYNKQATYLSVKYEQEIHFYADISITLSNRKDISYYLLYLSMQIKELLVLVRIISLYKRKYSKLKTYYHNTHLNI